MFSTPKFINSDKIQSMKTLIICAFILQNIIFPGNQAVIEIQKPDPFIHSVYFWLIDDISQSDRQLFYQTIQSLKKVKSVKKLFVLTPAGTPRDIVDNSYDFALIIHFKDRAAHDAYQVDSLHVRAADVMRPLVDHLIIYDAHKRIDN